MMVMMVKAETAGRLAVVLMCGVSSREEEMMMGLAGTRSIVVLKVWLGHPAAYHASQPPSLSVFAKRLIRLKYAWS
jgi:hypothetical protein